MNPMTQAVSVPFRIVRADDPVRRVTVDEAFRAWTHRRGRTRAESTCKGDRQVLRVCRLAGIDHIDQFSGDTVDLICELLEGACQPSSITVYLYKIKALCDWLVREGRLLRNPIYTDDFPRGDSTARRAFTPTEVRALAAHPGPRALLYRTYAGTGARNQELAKARWRDFDRERGAIRIPRARAKNRRAREAILSTAIAGTLTPGDPDAPIFPNRKGQVYSAGGLLGEMRKDAAKAGVEKPESTYIHGFRGAFRTALVRLSIHQDVCDLLLGHGRAAHVGADRYTDLDPTEFREHVDSVEAYFGLD